MIDGALLTHAFFLALAIATHALVGYTLGSVLADSPRAGLVGGLIADVDLLVPVAWGEPFAHRGITHSVLVAGASTALVARLGHRVALAFGAGYASQLLIDAATAIGAPLGYPFVTEPVGLDLGGHSPPVTAIIWLACVGLLRYDRR